DRAHAALADALEHSVALADHGPEEGVVGGGAGRGLGRSLGRARQGHWTFEFSTNVAEIRADAGPAPVPPRPCGASAPPPAAPPRAGPPPPPPARGRGILARPAARRLR